jgi:fumarate reductase flavoprotein subunit
LAVLPPWRRASAATSPYDLIVVGAGTAGMPLAIMAAESGSRVLVIEKSPVAGGTLDRAAGQTSAAGSIVQARKGISDTPQDHYSDIMRITQHAADPALTRLWTAHAAETVNWLISLGLDYPSTMPVVGGHEPYLIPRAQTPLGGGGTLWRTLEPLFAKSVASQKVRVQYNSRAVALLQDSKGAVVGVVVSGENGKRQDVYGRKVVLTSGGCMANQRMFEELHGSPLYYQSGYPFNEGDGLLLGLAAGGFLRGGDRYCPLLAMAMEDDRIPGFPVGQLDVHADRRPPWEIWVNARGERFVPEDSPSPHQKERALGWQPGHRMWAIHDHLAMEVFPSPIRTWSKEKYIDAFSSNPMFVKADTLQELSIRSGLHPAGLATSIQSYNESLARGTPDRLGRAHRPKPISKPPYYAIRLQGYTLMSFAGLAVDHDLRVIRQDGIPIPNLYAAGEVIGATATGGSGYCNGSMITPALTFGRLLGRRLGKIDV